MSRSEAFLSSAVQAASKIHTVQDNIVAVKIHPDSISVLQLDPAMDAAASSDGWRLDRIVTWSLGRNVGSAPLQEDFEYLVNQIRQVRIEANVTGLDAGISIPFSQFDTRILNLPFMLPEELEDESQLEGFWGENDLELNDLDGKIVRYQILSANENEDRTTVLFSSIPETTVKRYTDLLLEAGLMPVYIENEAFSLVNGIYTKLSFEDLQKPQLIVHLCPGHNVVIGFTKNSIEIFPISVSEFDDALLLELEELDDISGEFWDEVGIRVGEHINQAIAYLNEVKNFPTIKSFWLVSEHKNIGNVEILLRDRVGNLRLKKIELLEDIEVPPDQAKFVDYFNNSSVFTSALGLATQSINIAGYDDSQRYKKLLDINFLPNSGKIRTFRQFEAFNKLLIAAVCAVFVASALIIGITNIPELVSSSSKVVAYEALQGEAQTEAIRYKGLIKKLDKLRDNERKVGYFTEPKGFTIFMSSLAIMLPQDAELQKLYVKSDGTVILEGLSLSSSAINTFAAELVKSGLATQAPITQQKTSGYYRFTINAMIRQKG